MNAIHLLTPHMRAGDAVSNDVLGMRRWLQKRGHDVHTYAQRCQRGLRHIVRPLSEYESSLGNSGDWLIYHHSVGWPAGFRLWQRSRQRKIVRYHNVTPAAFFTAYQPAIASACRSGRKQLLCLVDSGPELWLGASAFNLQEVVQAGADPARCAAVPPLHALRRLARVLVDENLAASLSRVPTFLFVGRIAPNKGHGHLIRAFAHYHHYISRDSRLIFAGGLDPALAAYRRELDEELRRCRVEAAVEFAGNVSVRQLKTFYLHCRAFLCASEHEGFCVPLVEAMRLGLPIVSGSPSPAVSRTLDRTGLAWPTPSPALLAETIWQLESNETLRRQVIADQRRRYARHFTARAIGRKLQRALEPVLEGGTPVHAEPDA
jgi:glycosyltransferase involved in cell wall biosynthesis